MKYYLIEISTGNKKIQAKAVYEYVTLNEAKANFHQKLGNAMKSELYQSEQIMIITSDNGIIMSEKYVNESYVEATAESGVTE